MVTHKYADQVRRILEHLETNQPTAIEAAADLVVKSITNGGAVFCHEIGHGNQYDFLNRAGGLAVVQPFSFEFTLKNPISEHNQDRPHSEPFDLESERIRFGLKASNLRAGDVLMVSSVSGRNKGPIELAIACREMGIKVIGLTSMEYTSKVTSAHPSGKKLFEVVDVAIDNGAPFGDACVDIPGYDFKLLPISGVSMIVTGWMIWGLVMEKMAAAGNPPTVFMSANREGGMEYYQNAVAEYNKRGY